MPGAKPKRRSRCADLSVFRHCHGYWCRQSLYSRSLGAYVCRHTPHLTSRRCNPLKLVGLLPQMRPRRLRDTNHQFARFRNPLRCSIDTPSSCTLCRHRPTTSVSELLQPQHCATLISVSGRLKTSFRSPIVRCRRAGNPERTCGADMWPR